MFKRWFVALVFSMFVPAIAHADDPAADDPARGAFREGAALVDKAEWAAALTAFEKSLALRPHALTLYNIGVCQRFLGRFTLARQTLKSAAARADANPNEMPALFAEQSRAYLAEIESKLAHLTISMTPASTRVAVDGRPLLPSTERPEVLVAGIAEPGEGKAVPATRFEIIVDPRPTVLTFSLDGYDTIEVRKDPKPASREEVSISMSEQPAQIRVASNVKNALVHVDGVDVGMTPVIVSRPPGPRVVTVTTDGFVPYQAKLTLKPGQMVPLDAQLAPEKQPITKRWWFWAGSAAALAAAGVITYFIVRPAPTRPEADRGGLGWVAEVPSTASR